VIFIDILELNGLIGELSTYLEIDLYQKATITNIKEGDFTSVFKIELYHQCAKIGGRKTALIKICRPPLDTELEAYRLMQNHSSGILPGMFWESEKEDYCALLIEDLGEDILREHNIESELMINVLAAIIEVHNYYANGIKLSLSGSIPVREGDSFVNYFGALLSKANTILKMEKTTKEILLRKSEKIQSLLRTYRLTLTHGDLYADNIILSRDKFYLIDWGFAHFGVEFEDIATILETYPQKNGNMDFTTDQKVNIYRSAYQRVNKQELAVDRAKLNLCLGALMNQIYFVDWIIFRINNGYWKDIDPREKLNMEVNELIDAFYAVERLV
jgi:thiamine kinase-like enzyme